MEILENITENIIELKTEDVIELVCADHYVDARKILVTMNEADIALLFEEIPEEKILRVFRMLPKNLAAESFSYMKSELQQFIVESITEREIVSIVDEMFMDDTVDFLEEMPANVVKKVLKVTDPETRKIINQLLKYPDDSAGSIMTTEYVDLKKEMTVRDAISHIRATGVDKETINTCYVMDEKRHLEGTVSIRKLILSQPDEIISDIMTEEPMYIYTHDDQETGAHYFKKYDLLSMPVVDAEKRLVGIITIDDIVDVIEQETTEDIEMMAGMTPSDKSYIEEGVIETFKKRIIWLLLLMLTATFTGGILATFETSLAVYPALVAFIPMLMGTAGNAGGQSSVAVIRSLALDEIEFRDILKISWKEARVAAVSGAVMALVCFFKVMFIDSLYTHGIDIVVALVVSAAIFSTVVLAKVVGCTMPMIAKKIGLDPAVMASPFITTIVDALSLLIYFAIVSMVLPM
ncbi:MAG: magnesium transporter [Clostridia bacterium]|nr:magnesium transporter [Clostridia bacterium]